MRCPLDVRKVKAAAHGRDHPVDLVERDGSGAEHGRPVGVADGVAQLGGEGGPALVAVAAVKVRAPKTTRLLLKGIIVLAKGSP